MINHQYTNDQDHPKFTLHLLLFFLLGLFTLYVKRTPILLCLGIEEMRYNDSTVYKGKVCKQNTLIQKLNKMKI